MNDKLEFVIQQLQRRYDDRQLPAVARLVKKHMRTLNRIRKCETKPTVDTLDDLYDFLKSKVRNKIL